ncbi:unnamed protein product, partial [Sphacelaria rigidula]
SLPWQGLKAHTKKQKCRMIEVCKTTTPSQELCRGHPAEFLAFFEYVRDLRFEDTPDYKFMKRIFTDLFDRLRFVHDNIYDWTTVFRENKQRLESKGERSNGSSFKNG